MMNSRSQITQNNIIEAAYILFSKNGFSKTTTKEIADLAKVAELTIFRHFQNKYTLFQQVLLHYSPAYYLEEMMTDIEKKPFKEGLKELTHIFVTHLTKNRNVIRMTLMEESFDAEIKKVINPVRQKMLKHIMRFFQQKKIQNNLPPDLQLEEVVQAYMWSIFSSVVLLDREKMDNITASSEKLCSVFCAMFSKALG